MSNEGFPTPSLTALKGDPFNPTIGNYQKSIKNKYIY